MSAPADDAHREILPRWRDLQATTRLRELTPLRAREPQVLLPSDFLAEKITDWKREQSVLFAAEVVGAAVVLQRPAEAKEAANFVLSNPLDATPAILELAERIANNEPTPAAKPAVTLAALRGNVRTLKAAVRFELHNAFAWVELARCYTNVGSSRKALRCMDIALGLAPNNRYVLRSAARLYTHTGDNQTAHDILARAAVTPSDPWLVASEISTAALAGKSSKLIRAGTNLVVAQRFSPFDLAELAGTLATQDAKAGNLRGARKLFRASLREPNENVIAQARWAATQKFIDLDPELPRTAPEAFEARAWQAFYDGEWDVALKAGKSWLRDQPFAAIPAVHASYTAAIPLQDHRQALRILERGLLANPYHPWLLNNQAYSLAELGHLSEAEDALRRAHSKTQDGSTTVLLLATEGLLAYRKGEPETGRRLYLSAIEAAMRAGQQSLARKASLFFALEELRIRSEQAGTFAAQALSGSAGDSTSDVRLLRRRVEYAVTGPQPNSGRAN